MILSMVEQVSIVWLEEPEMTITMLTRHRMWSAIVGARRIAFVRQLAVTHWDQEVERTG